MLSAEGNVKFRFGVNTSGPSVWSGKLVLNQSKRSGDRHAVERPAILGIPTHVLIEVRLGYPVRALGQLVRNAVVEPVRKRVQDVVVLVQVAARVVPAELEGVRARHVGCTHAI